jgi:YegS/Rv2252/BmrU family lipid kinase
MVSIIINPISGGATLAEGQRRATRAAATLERLGEHGDVFLTESRGHGHELARASRRRGDRLVVAWGGDGTVNEIASALAGDCDTSLGIVPSGSGNGLARELHLPSDPTKALAAALRSPVRPVDAGELGGRLFFSVAGVGLDAHVAAAFDREAGPRRGFGSYAWLTTRELWHYRCGRYRIDHAEPISALLLTFANSAQFGNGARIAPGAQIDDGLLDLVIFEERSRLTTVRHLPKLFTGQVSRVRGVTIRKVEEAVVESDVPMTFHVDGEPVQGGTRLEARVLPRALKVAAP